MAITFIKTLRAWVSTFTLITLCGCSYVNEVDSPQPSPINQLTPAEEGCIHLRIAAFESKTYSNVTSIDLFQFSDGVFVKKLTVNASRDNIVEFERKPGSRVYALAGYSIEGSQAVSESDFSKMTIPVPKDSYSAPVFFSSITDLTEDSNDFNIELHKGVARLDIDNEDPELKIEWVGIAGAASCSHIFTTDGCNNGTASANYSRIYESGIDGIEESAFVLFETRSPITVTISGRRNGEAVEIVSETPAITRNSIYTVCIDKEISSNAKGHTLSYGGENGCDEGMPTASIKVRNWVEGDIESGSIDLEESAIDIERSSIPSGVRLNPGDNTITVPAYGVTGMKIAFTTKTPLRLGSVLSDTEGVNITPIAPLATDEGYNSEFIIDVEKQPKGAKRYQTTVFFNGSSSFFINIEVEPSPFQIPTVHIGGHDWMCFNAVSQDPEEQIYLPKGMTSKEMYREHFADCIGNMFQYGRPNPFSPWKAYNPNMFASQKRDVPWETKSMMPLPKGYHIPSAAEWEDLIPSGTIIPSSYKTRTGDSIRATIVTAPDILDNTPSAITNAQNYLKRGVLFESITTGARLFFPMAGIKTNTSCEIPTHPNYRFETKSGYWMKEENNVMLLDCEKQGDDTDGIKFKRDRWSADGFVLVRGVKD
ncbi:MAG: hypothetical protein K2N48_11030 [Muribaculaceae bacterium]|nr:hypothetical protein [Muribaculaceae bacterium]